MRDLTMLGVLAAALGALPESKRPRIAPPPRYRDTTCPESSVPCPGTTAWDDMQRDAAAHAARVAVASPTWSAAEAKRARKAAKRLKELGSTNSGEVKP